MASVGIRELRASLAAYVKRAQGGERLVVTIDGEPVAQLGHLSGDFTGVTIEDLVARGAVLPPRRRSHFFLDEPVVLPAGTRIDRALAQVRT